MKRYFIPIFLVLAGAVITACEKSIVTDLPDPQSVFVESTGLSIGEKDESGSSVSRAVVGDFSVNTSRDKTNTLAGRNSWDLFIQIYKGNTVYQWGAGHFIYSTDDTWLAPYDPNDVSKNVYFPNYTRQKVSAKMTPPSWSGTIARDQSAAGKIFSQDVLEQNANGTVTLMPAKKPSIPLRHAYSMLNFIIDGIDMDDLDWQNLNLADITANAVTVEANGVRYLPYKVDGSPHDAEYMVILPLGIQNPRIHLVTKEGAHYLQQINTGTTTANVCYCVNLLGLELTLSTVTVINWTYGEAISGDYTTITSYPTFRGPIDKEIIITYFNGLTQTFTFNDKGEHTIRPYGRRIVKLQVTGEAEVDLSTDPIVLNSMLIDLNPYLN